MTFSITIDQAMTNAHLFGPFFEGQSWDTWRACAKAAFGEPLTPAELVNFRRVADREPPTSRVGVFVAAAGRGAGKDSLASALSTHIAVNFNGQAKLRPGERAVVQLIACDREQAAIALSYIKGLFEQIPTLAAMVTSTDRNSISLSNRVDIEVATNSFKSVRGRSLVASIFDEAAFLPTDGSASPDTELYAAVRPGLARVPGSMLIVISSVYRRAGLLHDLWKGYFGKDDPDTLVVYGGTRDFNPSFPQSVIDKALAEDPALAGAEYLSIWRDDLATFVPRELIEAAVDPGVVVRPPLPNITYHAFCDGSGGINDSFTAAVAHQEGDRAVLDMVYERKAPFSPSEVVAEVASIVAPYGALQITGDRYSASWIVDAFAKAGMRYVHSERDRSAIYIDCLPLFTSGRARIVDNPRLVRQFSELERRTFSTGRDRVDHSSRGGAKDDVSNSAAGALVLAALDDAFDLAEYIAAYS